MDRRLRSIMLSALLQGWQTAPSMLVMEGSGVAVSESIDDIQIVKIDSNVWMILREDLHRFKLDQLKVTHTDLCVEIGQDFMELTSGLARAGVTPPILLARAVGD